MSYFYFHNLSISVPPVKDTTPCMENMLDYEDCIYDSDIKHLELVHPNWPTMFPRLLNDGHVSKNEYYKFDFNEEPKVKNEQVALNKKEKQFLWECEQERYIYKACLREVIGLKRTNKHRSWNTAEVANLQLTQKIKNYYLNKKKKNNIFIKYM